MTLRSELAKLSAVVKYIFFHSEGFTIREVDIFEYKVDSIFFELTDVNSGFQIIVSLHSEY